MKKKLRASIVASLLLAMLCGCDGKGTKTSAPATSTPIEPAMLITPEDAKELTGVDFGACTTKEQPGVGLKLCVYEKDGAFLQVGLTQGKTSANTPETLYKSTKDAFKGAEKIEGVGDDNFLAPPGLHILKDGCYITVSTGLQIKDMGQLKALGIKAVENLGRHAIK